MASPHDDQQGFDDGPAGASTLDSSRRGHNIDRFSAGWPPAYDEPPAAIARPSAEARQQAVTDADRAALSNLPDDVRHRPYLTVGDVAQLLGVTTQTVRNWSDAGRITPIRTPGGHRRFPTVDVARLVGDLAG